MSVVGVLTVLSTRHPIFTSDNLKYGFLLIPPIPALYPGEADHAETQHSPTRRGDNIVSVTELSPDKATSLCLVQCTPISQIPCH
jgi:hypothetical protein